MARMREVAKRWKAGCREEAQYKMIEALVHDLGKASRARFEDHAEASAELLRKAGFFDDAVLNLIERHHKSSGDRDTNLHLLQIADRHASSHRVDGGTSAAFIPYCEAFFGKAFFRKVLDKVLKELYEVGVLERDEERKYTLKRSLESKHSPKEVRFGLPSDDKFRDVIIEMQSAGFSVDGIAYQTGLPELHVREVLEGEIGLV